MESARHPLQQCRGKEIQHQGKGRLRVGDFVFILFKANCAIYKIMAKMMHLLQSFSYCWAEKQDNHSLFSLMHSTPLGSPAVKQSEQLEHRGLLSSSAIIPARAGKGLPTTGVYINTSLNPDQKVKRKGHLIPTLFMPNYSNHSGPMLVLLLKLKKKKITSHKKTENLIAPVHWSCILHLA